MRGSESFRKAINICVLYRWLPSHRCLLQVEFTKFHRWRSVHFRGSGDASVYDHQRWTGREDQYLQYRYVKDWCGKEPNEYTTIGEKIVFACLKMSRVPLMLLCYVSGPHSALVAKFTFHRRLGYYMIQTYIPSMLTVTISWFSFWISPDSPPARVGLGITTVLTMITISNSARAPLPKVSYTKAIDWFLLMCLVYVFGALMEYAIVNFYSCKVRYKRRKDTRKAEKEVSK